MSELWLAKSRNRARRTTLPAGIVTDQDAAELRRILNRYGLTKLLTELLRATSGWPGSYRGVRRYLKGAWLLSLGSEEMCKSAKGGR